MLPLLQLHYDRGVPPLRVVSRYYEVHALRGVRDVVLDRHARVPGDGGAPQYIPHVRQGVLPGTDLGLGRASSESLQYSGCHLLLQDAFA